MHKKLLLIGVALFIVFTNEVYSQKWVVKDSILVFPTNFDSWLKRNNGGIDLTDPPNVGNHRNGKAGTNQGIDVFDFDKDGLMDLTFEIHPHNTITREYLKGIFIQNKQGKYVLDTNYVIKGKGDMWYGGYADFNGDGLTDYHYLTHNYHGADSNRIYNSEMVIDDWPDRVFINNGKTFDTLSLDPSNYRIQSTYTADVDGDGADEIIATYSDRYNVATNVWTSSRITIYKYDKSLKKFIEIGNDLTKLWNETFSPQHSSYPVFSITGVNNNKEFYATLLDSANGNNIWDYRKFTLANYNFSTKKITTYSLNRDSVFIPEKFSKAGVDRPAFGGDDYFKFMIHGITYTSFHDLDNDGIKEIVVGGFFQNNHTISKEKYAYGWRVLGLNGKDLTTKFFDDNGIDRGTDLISHMLDIDEFNPGPEWIPGVWGLDPKYYIDKSPTLGYFYKYVDGKMQKSLIRDIYHESGKKLDSTYFFEKQITKYPEFKKNKNALLLYDFSDIKRSAILYQINCSELAKPIFSTTNLSFCPGDSLKLSINNINKSDSIKWYFGSNADLTNVVSKTFRDSVKLFVIRTDSIGCSASSDTIQLILYSKPAKPTTLASSVCIGEMANALSASATTGNSLRWYGTSATGGIASASAPTVSSSVVGVTNYYVSQVSAQGCESERGLLKHTVNPLPAKPVISWSGVQFSTTATGVNYQWLLNGTSISGATASTLKPLNIGDFKLRVTDTNGCVNVSDSFKLVVTALANLATTPASNIATVYPNPTSDKVVLEFATLPTINLNFQLVTPSGKVLSSTTGRNKVNIIDVSDIQSGNYFIRVIGKKYDQVKKVLIQK